MNHKPSFFRFVMVFNILAMGPSLPAYASDGFDNNYVGGDANQFSVIINGLNQALLFGPGQMSTGGYFINIPNGTTYNEGPISSFVLTSAASHLRSAYLDRVLSTALYYRIYAVSATPPGWTSLALQPQSVLPPGTCYNQTQDNTWQVNQSLDILQGLSNGDYVLEFYIRSELYDVGNEADPCNINALDQCDTTQKHPGRYISSCFNTTDPTACELANILANQSAPSKMIFQVVNSPLPVELGYFKGAVEGKNVRLNWGTLQEHHLQRFFIERSPDGLQWLLLAQLTAAGNSNVLIDYTFLDEQPFQTMNYYRLKALGVDGQEDVFPDIVVNISDTTGGLAIWPNPVTETLHYVLADQSNVPVMIRIFDIGGRVVLEQISDPGGIPSFSVGELPKGVYILGVFASSGRRIEVSRFVKV